MGCKGPVTYAPCPVTRWNGHQSWCIKAGPCIGCSEPKFWDTMAPILLAGAEHRRARHRRRLRLDVHRHPGRRRRPWRSARTWSGTIATGRLHGGGPMDEPAAPQAAERPAEPPQPKADGGGTEGGE